MTKEELDAIWPTLTTAEKDEMEDIAINGNKGRATQRFGIGRLLDLGLVYKASDGLRVDSFVFTEMFTRRKAENFA